MVGMMLVYCFSAAVSLYELGWQWSSWGWFFSEALTAFSGQALESTCLSWYSLQCLLKAAQSFLFQQQHDLILRDINIPPFVVVRSHLNTQFFGVKNLGKIWSVHSRHLLEPLGFQRRIARSCGPWEKSKGISNFKGKNVPYGGLHRIEGTSPVTSTPQT